MIDKETNNENEGHKCIVVPDEHGTTDERGIYIPAYGEGSGRSVLIEWSAIDEPMKALQVARQLSHKLWMTRETAAGFLDVVFQHFGWPKGAPYL